VQVTSRLVPGLRSLRSAPELAVVRDALARSARNGFQVVHHSIQSNHVHLIVEADDRKTLTSGLRALLVCLARELNQLWQHRGAVFADRFHERELRTPREVRNSLLYVLQNARKHGIWMRGPDPCSSGVEFDGWEPATERRGGPASGSAQSSRGFGLAADHRDSESSTAEPDGRRVDEKCAHVPASGALRRARTWLLGVGWQRHGLLRESEAPQGAFGSIGRRRAG
jgi:REP element-mobilizing transposase RayT